jgi:hypothetical protein
MTLGECLSNIKRLINYESVAGVMVPPSDPTLRDYMRRAVGAVNDALRELAAKSPLLRRVTYSQHTLRAAAVADGMRRLSGEMTLEGRGAGAFSMLCDGDVTVTLTRKVGGAWQSEVTAQHEDSGKLETFSLTMPTLPGEDDEIRTVITGEGVFVASAALYRAFPENEGIPIYGARRFHPLPEDFGGLRSVTAKPFYRARGLMRMYAVENGGIGFPWDFDGTAELTYVSLPAMVTGDTPESTVLDAAEECADAIPYFAAALLLAEEEPELSERYMKRYQSRLNDTPGGTGRRVHNTLFGGAV